MNTPTIRDLKRHDLNDVVRIDAIHTGAEQRKYWKRLFYEFLGPSPAKARIVFAYSEGLLAHGFEELGV